MKDILFADVCELILLHNFFVFSKKKKHKKYCVNSSEATKQIGF